MPRFTWAFVGILLAGCSPESGTDETDDGITCDPDGPASRTIACVASFSPGDGAGFGQDHYPDIIYGEPKGGGVHGGSIDVLSLGKLGSIVVGFDGGAIADGPGADFIVFENTFYLNDDPQKPFKELGEVSVSDDGDNWVSFPCKEDAFPYDGCAGWRAVLAGSEPDVSAFDPATAGGDAFDLADVGVERARFVRIVDRSNFGAGGNAGFDLDAVTIVNAAP